MSSLTSEIAHELIALEAPLQPDAVTLFGHDRPFGTRWRISSGIVNLEHFKTTERRVDLYNSSSSDSSRINFRKLYRPDTLGSCPLQETSPELQAIFSGVRRVLFRATLERGYQGKLVFDEVAPEVGKTSHTTADLGRMMLIDDLLFDQGIRGGSRQWMSPAQALGVAIAVGSITPSA